MPRRILSRGRLVARILTEGPATLSVQMGCGSFRSLPPGLSADTAFVAGLSVNGGDQRVLAFSVAFMEEKLAVNFLGEVDRYVAENDDLYFCTEEGSATTRPNVQPIPSFPIHSYVFPSDYVPRNGEADPPFDSLTVDMSVGLRSTSSLSEATVVTVLTDTDDVFNFQRTENEDVFVLSVAESAHIFPRAKCVENQKYKWLNEPDFNRLALSRDFRANYDGSGRGRGKRPRTVQQLTLRPMRPAEGFSLRTLELHGTEQYFEIPLQLVFKDDSKADKWMQRLPNKVILHRPRDKHCYATGLKIYCLASRKITLMFEPLQQPDRSMEYELLTAVPGIENLDDCWSIERGNDGVRLLVAEIMEKCLQWNYEQALRMWAQVG